MKSKLQIVFITNNYTPYQGGVVSSIKAARKELEALGHTVSLITLDFEGSPSPEEEPGVYRIYCPIKFTYKSNHMALPWQPKKQIKEYIKKLTPDIIHTHHPFFLGSIAADIAKEMNIPLIFTHHTRYELYAHYVPLPESITQKLIEKIVTNFYQKADAVIAPSLSMKTIISEKTKMGVIPIALPSTIDKHFFKPFEKQPSKILRLLCVARWRKEKNIECLLEVMKKLEDEEISLTLIGYGDYKKYLQDKAYKELKLSQIRFIEKPSKDELITEYQKADCFVFTSISETQGIVLEEALATGNPLIALDAPGSRDAIRHGFNGYLLHDKEEMIQKIKLLKNNKGLLNQLQENARKSIKSKQGLRMGKALSDHYHHLLAASREKAKPH